jgi:signal recognition particle receptor subunit alpha
VNETPVTAEEIAKNVQALKGRMRGKGRGTPSPTSSPKKPNTAAASKLMRKWGDSQQSVTAEDMASLDYSTPPPNSDSSPETPALVDTDALVSAEAMGVRTSNGYEVADWDYRREELPTEDEILAKATSKLDHNSSTEEEEVGGRWGNMFSRLTGKKTLTNEDLKPVLAEMERNLMDKNVAKDISEKLCESVGAALVGKKLGGLTSTSNPAEASVPGQLK